MEQERYALLVSDYNPEITHELLKGAVESLKQAGISQGAMAIYHVPGAVELPLCAKWCAESSQFAAIICLGAVIKGDTDHYQYVCEQVSAGCQQVMLTYGLPVIFGVLTVQDDNQALARIGGSEGHKGREAAAAALAMVALSRQFRDV